MIVLYSLFTFSMLVTMESTKGGVTNSHFDMAIWYFPVSQHLYTPPTLKIEKKVNALDNILPLCHIFKS